MAILLVKAQDNNVPDSPGKWRMGDVVTVVDDDHVFGGMELESAGKFRHISLPGPKEDYQYLVGQQQETAAQATSPALRRIPKLANRVLQQTERKAVSRSRYHVAVDQTITDKRRL